jgi:hypothetical protein
MTFRTGGLAAILFAGFLGVPAAQAQQGTDCSAPTDWFPHAQTPPPDDNADFNSNCAFHLWSWQAFLFLTQNDEDGMPRFLSLIPAQDVVDGVPDTEPDEVMLRPRARKSDMGETFDEVGQAGSLGLLVDQNGRAVYYSMYVNETYYDFVVTQNQYNVPANLLAAPADQNYPIGSVTLKAAWKIMGADEDASGFFTMPATIEKLSADAAGNVIADPGQTEEVTVALVGLHVVGIVKGHPEAIWATFEHRNNAPQFSLGQIIDEPVSSQDFTFYAANTTAGTCNQNNAGFLTLTDPATQTLSPVTQVCRQYPFGGGSTQNSANIGSLNSTVHAGLEADSVWRNYMETGAIWFSQADALEPNMAMDDSIITGSVKLSNSVIETFTQKVRSEDQCFSCHRTDMVFPPDAVDQPLPGKNLNISHILLNAYVQNLEAK